MEEHINTLKELKKIFCEDCDMRKQGISCCVSKTDDFRLCDYIISLNLAIELLEKINSTIKE